MEIVFISAEILPFSSSTTASVASALPKALRSLEHRVSCISPLYQSIDPTRQALARRLTPLKFDVDGEEQKCALYHGRTAGGIELKFIGHDQAFGKTDTFFGSEEENAFRAGVFARAAARVIAHADPKPELVVAFDWVGAVALQAIADYEDTKELPRFLALQSHDWPEFSAEGASTLGLSGDAAVRPVDVAAELVETVVVGSHRLANAVLERSESVKVDTIANGCDASIWNPTTDPQIAARFDAIEQSGKEHCRVAVQRELGLPIRNDIPLVGVWGSDSDDDGLDLVVETLPALLHNDVQVAFVHQNETKHLAKLEELATEYDERLKLRAESDVVAGPFVHQVLAAADIVLVPRRSAVGLEHLYAHRYGAIPVAPSDGAFGDALVDCDPALLSGTAFLFEQGSAPGLLSASQRAVGAYLDREGFEALREKLMRLDHSWDRAARLYERLFRATLNPDEVEQLPLSSPPPAP